MLSRMTPLPYTAKLRKRRYLLAALAFAVVAAAGVIGALNGAGGGGVFVALLFAAVAIVMLLPLRFAANALTITEHGIDAPFARVSASWHDYGLPELREVAGARNSVMHLLVLPPPAGNLDGRDEVNIPLDGLAATPEEVLAAALSVPGRL